MVIKIYVLAFLLIAATGCGGTAESNNSGLDPAKIDENAELRTSVEPAPMPPRAVKFVSDGNIVIAGTFYESGEANSPAVLLLHQWQSDKSSYSEFAIKLQAAGFGVLAIDGRGFGESVKTTDGQAVGAERSIEAVVSMKKDVEKAFLFLAQQNNVDAKRIGIVGASYGSSLAIMYAADEPKVQAVALLSPGTNYFGNMPVGPAVKRYGDRPLLLVAAVDDPDSAEAVRKLGESGNEKYESKVYESGGHGTNIFGENVGLEQLLEEFLRKSLQMAD